MLLVILIVMSSVDVDGIWREIVEDRVHALLELDDRTKDA